ncbi:MAG: hypothetical protein QOJ07_2740 [Thermoleophilaceae bacterium]|nr:hypothetical protein [Thermoleophilaceae bacterium]
MTPPRGDGERPDPRRRPPDPAGTRPRHDPDSLLPRRREPQRSGGSLFNAADVVEEHDAPRAPEFLVPQAATAESAAAAATPRRVDTDFTPRFQFLLGGLIAVALASLTIFGALTFGDGPGDNNAARSGPLWSDWAPRSGAGSAPTQIAEHVGEEYHLPDGKQLVLATGGSLEIAGLPLTVALRKSADQGGDIKLFDGKGVLYRLCGLGPKCAIATGKASTSRHLLLRREALELALYSFRYLDVDQAVVFMPPRKGQDPTQALFFRRADVEPAIDQPLRATLAPHVPSVRSVTRSPDARLVDELTSRTLYKFSLTQANQDNRAFLVLDPLVTKP